VTDIEALMKKLHDAGYFATRMGTSSGDDIVGMRLFVGHYDIPTTNVSVEAAPACRTGLSPSPGPPSRSEPEDHQ
jgi:hypothetical protein